MKVGRHPVDALQALEGEPHQNCDSKLKRINPRGSCRSDRARAAFAGDVSTVNCR
jgi:hypothetical protein